MLDENIDFQIQWMIMVFVFSFTIAILMSEFWSEPDTFGWKTKTITIHSHFLLLFTWLLSITEKWIKINFIIIKANIKARYIIVYNL